MHRDRIRRESLLGKVVSAEEAARFIKNGMTIGMSGFTRAGEAKAVPLALAERAAHQELKITLMTGASLGNDLDKILTQGSEVVIPRTCWKRLFPGHDVFRKPGTMKDAGVKQRAQEAVTP